MRKRGRYLALVVCGIIGCSHEHSSAVLSGSLSSSDGRPVAGTVFVNYGRNGESAQITVHVPANGSYRVTVAPDAYDVFATDDKGDRCGGVKSMTLGSGDKRTVDFVCPA